MPERTPVIGDIVLFMYGGVPVPAIVTDPAFFVREQGQPDRIFQVMTVFLLNAPPFTTVASYGDEVGPGTWLNATWHYRD